jgi:hypothetical protein
MSRIKHPVRAIREPFGTAGLVVACIALVLALTGAAFAAGKLTSKEKKEVEKIAKKFAGKPGPAGPAGANGSNGANGKDGVNGVNGAPGQNGESVTITNLAPGECANGEGGARFEAGSEEAEACNGKEGSPWTAGGTLPSGKTETGTWSWAVGSAGPAFSAISFPIPLAESLISSQVHFIEGPGSEAEGEELIIAPGEGLLKQPTECPGTFAEPKAEPGNLCVYTRFAFEVQMFSAKNEAEETKNVPRGELSSGAGALPVFGGSVGGGADGAVLAMTAEGTSLAYGTWAVTAE